MVGVLQKAIGANVSLTMTPRGLTPFDAPNNLKALAVEFRLSQSVPVTRAAELPQSHSVVTMLDFDELPVFRSLFNSLANTGMPPQRFSDANAVVRIASKNRHASGIHGGARRPDPLRGCE